MKIGIVRENIYLHSSLIGFLLCSEGGEEEDQEYRGCQPENQEKSTDHPSLNPRPIGNPTTTNGSEKSFDDMMDSDALDEAQGYGTPNQNRAGDLPNAAANRDYYSPTDGEISHLVDNEPIRGEGQQGLLRLGEPAAKIPRISKIEKVQMNMQIDEQNIDDDPLKQYFARSESNASSNWIPSRHLSSVFSNSAADYQRGEMILCRPNRLGKWFCTVKIDGFSVSKSRACRFVVIIFMYLRCKYDSGYWVSESDAVS